MGRGLDQVCSISAIPALGAEQRNFTLTFASKPIRVSVMVVDMRSVRCGGYALQGWDIILIVVDMLKRGWVITVIVVDVSRWGGISCSSSHALLVLRLWLSGARSVE